MSPLEAYRARREAEAVSSASPAHLQGSDGRPATARIGSRLTVIAMPPNPLGSLERAGQQIDRAHAGGSTTPADLRAALVAYQAEAAARDELARHRQTEGARSLDITVDQPARGSRSPRTAAGEAT